MNLTKRVEYLSEDLTDVSCELEKLKHIVNTLHEEMFSCASTGKAELALARIDHDMVMLSIITDYLSKVFKTVTRLDNEVEQWNVSLQKQQQDE